MDSYDSLDFDLLLDDFIGFENELGSTTSEDFSASDDNSLILYPISMEKAVKPKKKRIRKRNPLPVVPGPKVIKNDIRRSYANMFVNVMNACDFNLMYGMLDTFFAPNFQQSFAKAVDGVLAPDHEMRVRGVYQAAQNWFTSLIVAPDIVVELKNTAVYYHEGKIVASVYFSATKLYEDKVDLNSCSELVAEDLRRLDMNTNEVEYVEQVSKKSCGEAEDNEDCIVTGNSEATVARLLKSVKSMVNGLVLRETPEMFYGKGTFTMFTNDDKMITAMEWYANTSSSPLQ